MTLIVSVQSSETIWLLSDRRLTAKGVAIKDDAIKITTLQTIDGVALIGYAGLGMTVGGTQPSEWMKDSLVGLNLPMEDCLGRLFEAAKKELPRHLIPMGADAMHAFVIPTIIEGETRLYRIALKKAASPQADLEFYFERLITDKQTLTGVRTYPFCVAGSGADFLLKNKELLRDIFRLIKACDKQRVSPDEVADHFANLNHFVHLGTPDGTVGPASIVAWRHKKDGVFKVGGGHCSYSGVSRDQDLIMLPTLSVGLDVGAIASTMIPYVMRHFEDMKKGEAPKEIDVAEINEKLAELPETPDTNLR